MKYIISYTLPVIILYTYFFSLNSIMNGKTMNDQNPDDETLWEVLAKVTWEIDRDRGMYIPTFDQEIEKLNDQEITIKGYLFPLGYGMQSSEFLLTPYPIRGCFYCVPGSSETMIYLPEIELKEIPYSKVTVVGKFKLVRDSPYGLIYEVMEAEINE